MKKLIHMLVIFVTVAQIISCNGSVIDSAIRSKYLVYYNKAENYYLVSGKKTPSSCFQVWENKKEYFLMRTTVEQTNYFEYGPYKNIDDAIEFAQFNSSLNVYTWDYYEKDGNDLISKYDNSVLKNISN